MLYYPHYTPSQERLRSLLLFCNTVSLIVPEVDQPGVQDRKHVRDLLELDSSLIEFKDPTYRYSGWIQKHGVAQATENLILELVEKTEQENGLVPIVFDRHGFVKPGQDDEIAERWSRQGWKYVARQKFPPDFHDLFFRDGMALQVGHFRNPTTNAIVEHDGVLCHPELADFVLSRMAREASLVESIPSITFGGINYVNHLFDGAQSRTNNRFRLLQSAMDFLVPDNIEKCNPSEFMGMRREYQSIRHNVWRYLDEVSRDTNLDLEIGDLNTLLDRLEEAREQIADELGAAKRAVGRDRFRSGTLFALEASATIGLAALGAHLGGAWAAAGTTGLGIAVARQMSTLKRERQGTANSIAMSIAKLERRGVPTRRKVPNYFL
jgi:hypothetical protein